MILAWFVLILLFGGLLAAVTARWSEAAPRWISLGAVVLDLGIALALWLQHTNTELDCNWIPSFGIHFHLALDGLSLVLLLLTCFLGIISILASWTEIQQSIGFFHFNLMWVLAGISGVFLASDLFLFYFAWELMLIPMYFLIAIWGHENRVYASVKFFLFTQAGGLFMLLSILALYFAHHSVTGVYTFQYRELLGTAMTSNMQLWIMLGFFVGFGVKLPVVLLHTWLPDAHTEAPTAGSIILAGLLLKTGAYGMLRFLLPLFPEAAHRFAPVAMGLGVAGILYGAVMAFGQSDLKRLVAYTSVSHLGFVLLGIFADNPLALQGAVVTMVCHGLSTGGLFMLVGGLQQRMHTRELSRMGGLWTVVPRLSGAALFFTLASIGLPGLGDFVGEFLVLFGTYQVSIPLAALASIGVLAATFYGLKMVQLAFQGAVAPDLRIPDLSAREALMAALLIVALLGLGFYPQPILNTFQPAMTSLTALRR
jgi:NADH-quinone oxidoreductase subunit M